MVDIVKKL